MGFWSALGKIGSVVAAPFTGGASLGLLPVIDTIGQMAGGAATSMAGNRGAELTARQLQDQIAVQRAAEDRAERGDAWKKLLHTDYTMGSKGYAPAQLTSQFTGTNALPTFGTAHTGGPSGAVQQGATGLQREVLRRLQGGSTLPPPADVTKLSQMGGWEKFLNVLSPAASFAGAAMRRRQQPRDVPYSYGLPSGTLPGRNIGID
jgi:hypothetical protein